MDEVNIGEETGNEEEEQKEKEYAFEPVPFSLPVQIHAQGKLKKIRRFTLI